jgi:predicted PurR-regulated permease PerM
MYILKNKIMKNLSLIALYLAFFAVSLLVYLLYIGQDLVIPLVMAFLIASMISALNNTIKKVRYISYISMPLSFALIIFVLYLL